MVRTLSETDDDEFRCAEDRDVYGMVSSPYRAVSETHFSNTNETNHFLAQVVSLHTYASRL